MQKKFCRLVTFSHFSAHSAPLFSQLNLLNIYSIYKYNLATYMFRIQNNLLPALGHHQFVVNSASHEYGTRKKDDLKLPYCRTNLRQNTICFQGPKLWNNPPSDIKKTKSLNIFKRGIRQLVVDLNLWITVWEWIYFEPATSSSLFSSSFFFLLLHLLLQTKISPVTLP